MKYSELVELYDEVGEVSSKLEKADIIGEFLRDKEGQDLRYSALLILGRVFPAHDQRDLGIADKTMSSILGRVAGYEQEEIEEMFADEGDLGTVAEKLLSKKRQRSLTSRELTTEMVMDNLRELPEITGENSEGRKEERVAELLASATPEEARYLVRTVLGDLRIGVAEGLMRDGVAKAFLDTEDSEGEEAVEYAWNILSDFGKVAETAKEEGIEGLREVEFELGKPFHMMLALAADTPEEVLDEYGEVLVEIKYDGMRAQIHKDGEDVWIFTRRLEDVTEQFPDVVESVKDAVEAEKAIIDSELWALDEDGNPLPFQQLSQRIKRKYDIEEMAETVPVKVNAFDILYLDGEMLLEKSLKDRRELLEDNVSENERFVPAEYIVTADQEEIDEFYEHALELNQEGIMVKVADAPYDFGRHVGGWYKIKPVMETLDLVIVGATWGEGKRSHWLSSYLLAGRDPETGDLLSCGKMSTGLTEEQYEEMTERLEPLIEKQEGREVTVNPEVVVEVGYQDIQESPTYDSGYALRFPRLERIRTDKGVGEADTLEKIERLYEGQGDNG